MQLNELEWRVLRTAASVRQLPEKFLRQIENLRVERREQTGFGFFSYLAVDEQFACEFPDAVLSLWASHPDIANGESGTITFNIFHENGLVTLLEGACIENWPTPEQLIQVDI